MLRFQRILNRIHIIRLCKSQSGSDTMGVFTSDMRKKGNYYRTAKAYLSVFVNGKKSLSFRVFFSFFVHNCLTPISPTLEFLITLQVGIFLYLLSKKQCRWELFPKINKRLGPNKAM